MIGRLGTQVKVGGATGVGSALRMARNLAGSENTVAPLPGLPNGGLQT